MMLYTLGKLSLGDTGFSRLKPLMLLAYLSLEGAQSRAHLSQMFWADAKDPLGALSVALSRLRKAGVYHFEGDQYSVKSAVPTDVQNFVQAVEQREHRAALELYAGPFLADVAPPDWSPALESWVYTTRETLAAQARACLMSLAQRYADAGQVDLAAHYAELAYKLPAAPALEPDMLEQLFALLSGGKGGLAELVAAEASELGFTLSAASAEPALVKSLKRGKVPPLSQALIGRREEMSALSTQLRQPSCRLLTLIGVGGIGKSHLALALAHEQLGSSTFSDGVYFVRLESLSSPELIPARIAETLELPLNTRETPADLIKSFLGMKRVLLVLDNFEHLLEGAAVLSELLSTCPSLTCLVTSRARLGLRDEWVFRVDGLTYPEADEPGTLLAYDAPRFFVQRAKRALINLDLTETDYTHLTRLCTLTGGMPLALELAAAWLLTLPLGEVVEEVECNVEFLSSAHYDANERHKSIAGILGASWQRMSQPDQEVLLKLSVFEGGFTREAATQVADLTLGTLANLTNASLLNRSASGRYRFHPLMRQYLGAQLVERGGEGAARAAHAAFFLELAKRAEPNLEGAEQTSWLKRLDEELDNFRAALRWTIEEAETEIALELTMCLKRFWGVRSVEEGFGWLVQALDLPRVQDQELNVRALDTAGRLAGLQGKLETACQYFERGILASESLGCKMLIGELFSGLGLAMACLGNHDAARCHYEKALAISRDLDDLKGVAASLHNMGMLEDDQGNYSAARIYFNESLTARRRLGDQYGVAQALNSLAPVELSQENYAAARRCCEESLAISKRLGDRLGTVKSLVYLGAAEESEKNYEAAQTYYQSSLTIVEDLDNKFYMAIVLTHMCGIALLRGNCDLSQYYLRRSLTISSQLNLKSVAVSGLENAARFACLSGEYRRAIHLWGSANRLRQEMGEPLVAYRRRIYEQGVATARANLSAKTFKAAWEAGEEMTLEEAVAYALNLNLLTQTPAATTTTSTPLLR